MKKTIKATIMALALGLCGLAAIGQPSDSNPPPPGDAPPPDGPPGRPGHGRPRPAIMAALDANGDGIISAEEIANAPAALKSLDKNGDGQLTPDEYLGRPPHTRRRRPGGPDGSGSGYNTSGTGAQEPGDRPPHDGPPDGQGQGAPGSAGFRPPIPPVVAALDANGDGIISADEIANASAALLKLDKNGDGQLTPDEYRPKGPGPRGIRGPGGPNGHRPPPGANENSQNPPLPDKQQ